MVGVTGPARGERSGTRRRKIVGYGIGLALAGIALAVTLSMAGAALRVTTSQRDRLWALGALLLVLVLADAVNRVPMVSRQTPKQLFDRLTPLTAGSLAGFDIGLGVTTYRVSNAFWAWLAVAALSGRLVPPILGTSVYEATLLTTMLMGPRVLQPRTRALVRRVRVDSAARALEPAWFDVASMDLVACKRRQARVLGRLTIAASAVAALVGAALIGG